MEKSENPVTEEVVAKKEESKEVRKMTRDALAISSAILLGSLIIAGAILSSWGPIQGQGKNAPLAAGEENAAGNEGALEDTKATTTLDDDPVLGDKTKAKVAIVEFSDYECPFCKRFHAETFDKLVKDYVDTGKAIIVARDFPLSFHDPKATDEAALAECVGKEKGDAAYFAFGKAIYTNTQTNGKGLVEGKLDELIKTAGANVTSVKACAATEAVKSEITKDLADGQKAGISGTPSFVIGTLDANGNVTGERVVGALQYDGFKAVIDKYLE